jgi:peroxiredoxin
MKTNLPTKSQIDSQKKEPITNKKKFKIPILLLIIILTIVGVSFYLFLSTTSNQGFIFTTAQNRNFHIRTQKNFIEIEELKGKIVFLKVFGWDCQYCQKEIPELIKLKDKFVNAFDTIAIELQHHSNSENIEYIKKYNINYNIVNGDRQKKFIQYLKDEYKWNGVIPLTIVIDASGKILAFEVGYKSYSLTTLLQTTLKQLTTVVSNKKE